ncbi:MAG TPA: DUF177 domain-containing protein [Clostridia bacterium]|nr:DUF177 domain-containing protein [Clostridia bacterium]
MIIKLEPVFNNIGFEKSFDYELAFSEDLWNEDDPFTTPVKVKGSIKNRAGVVELRALVVADTQQICDRCAANFSKRLEIPVEHVLVTQLNNEDNDEFIVIEDMRFNLDSLIREDILLELPAKVLCSEDCKGICSQCGKNLNEGPCSCEKPIDHRLEALKQLLDN